LHHDSVAVLLLKSLLLVQNQWKAGRLAIDDVNGSQSRPEPIGIDTGNGIMLPETATAEVAASKTPPALALVLADSPAGLESNGSRLTRGNSILTMGSSRFTLGNADPGPETVEAKLEGLDWKIERIAGAVGAKIGSGVRNTTTRGVGGGLVEHSVYPL
jgi:hypothetical protein